MAVLDKLKQDEIDDLRFSANQFYKTDKIKYFEMKLKAWDMYPEPKQNWNEAYSLAKDFFKVYLRESETEMAKEWLDKMIENNLNLHLDDDDINFNIGKYSFEIGEYQVALNKWKEVEKEAGLRYFEREKPEYLDFYLHPEKYIKD